MVRLYAFRRFLLIAVSVLMLNHAALWAQVAPISESPKPTDGVSSIATAGNISSDTLKPKILELWNTPSLEGSQLKSHGAATLSEPDTIDSAYVQEVQRVQWRPADPIDLYIVKPVGIKKPPVVLYLFSYPFETDRFYDHAFCKFLVKNGVAAVGFATALTGSRYHDRPMKEWFVSQLDESLATSAHDVQMILNYLTDRGDLDMAHVGIFGDGSGASIAILSAAADSRIKALDLLDPWGDWPDWVAKSSRIPEKERPDFMKPEWLQHVEPLDPMQWLPKLKTQKVRLQFVKSVMITPADVQAKIESVAPPNAQIVHYNDTAAFQAAVSDGSGFDWIKQQVHGNSAAQYRAAVKAPAKTSSGHTKDSQQ